MVELGIIINIRFFFCIESHAYESAHARARTHTHTRFSSLFSSVRRTVID